jgi:hypothetical protein
VFAKIKSTGGRAIFAALDLTALLCVPWAHCLD